MNLQTSSLLVTTKRDDNHDHISVKEAKRLWIAWDIRAMILVSFLIQVMLTFLAPLRKRSASGPLKMALWFLYLSTTAIGLYTISQISRSPDDSVYTDNMLAFWSPFLLLHLGGPDSITALALEDNELWHRHVLELVAQLGITLYVFVFSVLRNRSPLLLPTVLMFFNGGVKYLERVQALYYASIDSFRDSLETDPEPGPNYARLMDVYYSSTTAYIPSEIQGKDDPFGVVGHVRATSTTNEDLILKSGGDFIRKDEDKLVIEAYGFYNKFKGLLADNYLSLKDCKECREVFLKKTDSEAVRTIEIELNLMYDTFYTKAFLLDSKQAILRTITFGAVILSLVWFSLMDTSVYEMPDVIISYILLVGAIALDVSAGVMFALSDWYIIINDKHLRLKQWKFYISRAILRFSKMFRRPNCKRWSRSISEYNLLKRCFKEPPSIIKYIGLRRIRELIIGLFFVKRDHTQEEIIVKFIVEQLKRKAQLTLDDDDFEMVKKIKEVSSARGNLFLEDDYCLISHYLQPWTTDVDYDESLLTWHLATDICFYTRNTNSNNTPDDEVDEELVKISKTLSDYMSYLLLRQQSLVSIVVGMSDKRFADTCAEAKKFMMTCKRSLLERRRGKETEFMKDFCKHLLNVHVDVRPIVAKGDKSKSVLFEACRLAKQLKMLGEVKQWEITSKVWLELMCFAAVRCSPRAHVAQLNQGGEVITLVWLLMAHLGFGERFLQNQGFGLTKLIIQK